MTEPTPTLAAPPPGRAWLRHPMILAAGAAVIVLAAVALFALGVFAPSYPHPWCGPLITRLQSRTGTETSFENDLGRIADRQHAPLGTLLYDLATYDIAYSAVQNGSILDAQGNLAAEGRALSAVNADLRSLNRQCGQSPTAYEHDSI